MKYFVSIYLYDRKQYNSYIVDSKKLDPKIDNFLDRVYEYIRNIDIFNNAFDIVSLNNIEIKDKKCHNK